MAMPARATYVSWGQDDWTPELMDWVTSELGNSGVVFRRILCQTREDLAANAYDADFLVYSGTHPLLTAESLGAIPRCWAIVVFGSGVDTIAVDAATERGIIVTNTPQGLIESVSDHAIALLFSIARRIVWQDGLVRHGTWNKGMAPPAF